MEQKFYDLLMRHLSLMDKVKFQSIELYRQCFGENTQAISLGVENRQRMVAELNRLQSQIIRDFSSFADEISEYWRQDIEYFIRLITRIDQEMTDVLQFQKDRTVKELADLRQEKDNVKRFNLSSLR